MNEQDIAPQPPAEPVLHRVTVRPYQYRGDTYWHGECAVCRFVTSDADQAVVQERARWHATPALEFLTDADRLVGLTYGPGVFCPDCPFRDPAPSYEERQGGYIDNDPTEAHYDCRLLHDKVWGEYSPCRQADWQRQARAELSELLRPSAESGT